MRIEYHPAIEAELAEIRDYYKLFRQFNIQPAEETIWQWVLHHLQAHSQSSPSRLN